MNAVTLLRLCDDGNTAVSLFSFLHPVQDFPRLRQVCNRFMKLIPAIRKRDFFVTLTPVQAQDDDTFKYWSTLFTSMPEKLVDIEIEFDWNDQGWGNRKSCLSLRL